MIDRAAPVGRTATTERLFERIQDKAGARHPAGAPAYDPSGVGIDDEANVDQRCPSRNIGEARHPSLFDAGAENWWLT